MLSQSTFKRFFNSSIATKGPKQQSRQLTAGEIALARLVFGDTINLDNVHLKTAWWVLKHYAVSPNGNIYFHPANWCEDFTQDTILKQSWFIHELVHVWQYQQGVKLIRTALFDRKYNYVLQQGKQFFQYGIEQQAQMVQDYFIRLHTGQPCQDLATCIPFIPK